MRGSAPNKDNDHHDEHCSHRHYQNHRCCQARHPCRCGEGRPQEGCPTEKDGPKTRKATRKNQAKSKPVANQQAKPASNQAAPARSGSKKATILELLRRPNGATLTEIGKATLWQNHSIRGFLSGTLRKKMSLPVESSRNQAGDRTYRLAK